MFHLYGHIFSKACGDIDGETVQPIGRASTSDDGTFKPDFGTS